jgi:O-antigen/teichoic acid export membrane protein
MKRISFLWLSPTLTAVGRRFGIDAHYFAKNSALVLLGHIVTIGRGVVSGYLVARLFKPEVYGEYQFMLSIVGMLGLFGMAGLAHSVTRAWARGDAFSLRFITKRHLMVCGIASLLLIGAIPFLGRYDREELWPLFLVAALLFPLGPVTTVQFGGYTVGKTRFDLALKANIVWSAIMIAATLLILLYAQSALLMYVAATAIPPLVYLWYSRGIRPPAEKSVTNSKAIMKYGWQLSFATLPVDLVWYVDKLLISHFFGLNQLALFSVAILVPEQVKIFIKQFLPISFARQAAGSDSRSRRDRLIRVVLLGTAIFAAGITVYILLTPFLMPLLFPNYDAQQLILLTSISAATVITQPGALFAQYLEAQGMIRANQWSNWGAAAAFIIALVTLIPLYGLLGAVIARGVFRFVYWGMTWWFVLRAPLTPSVKPA